MRDKKAEDKILSLDFQVVYEEAVDYRTVDLAPTINVRLEGVDRHGLSEEAVGAYQAAMVNGADFNSPVFGRSRTGRLFVIDGRHRSTAAIRAEKFIGDALIIPDVEPNDPKIIALAGILNHINETVPTGRKSRIHFAVSAYASGVMTAVMAAKEFSLSVDVIENRKRELEVLADISAGRDGVRVKDREISQAATLKIGQIRNPDIRRAAARFIIDRQLIGQPAVEAIDRLIGARRESEQLGALEQLAREYPATGAFPPPKRRKAKMRPLEHLANRLPVIWRDIERAKGDSQGKIRGMEFVPRLQKTAAKINDLVLHLKALHAKKRRA